MDIEPQKHYPFDFVQADALEYAHDNGHVFAAIHASPPCQGYSRMNHIHKRDYPLLVEPVRDLLLSIGSPYVIENVEGAPLNNPITLCGVAFGLKVIRHRLFESNLSLVEPEHQPHVGELYSVTGHGDPNWRHGAANPHLRGKGYADRCRDAMGIDWMTRAELVEAIPPKYTEWIGRQLLAALELAA